MSSVSASFQKKVAAEASRMAAEAAAVPSFILPKPAGGNGCACAICIYHDPEQDPQVIKDRAVAALELKFFHQYAMLIYPNKSAIFYIYILLWIFCGI